MSAKEKKLKIAKINFVQNFACYDDFLENESLVIVRLLEAKIIGEGKVENSENKFRSKFYLLRRLLRK